MKEEVRLLLGRLPNILCQELLRSLCPLRDNRRHLRKLVETFHYERKQDKASDQILNEIHYL